MVTMTLMAGVAATALAACVPYPTTVPKPLITPPAQGPAVLQRSATLTVPPGTYGMKMASCATGETMVSGGWSTTALLPANTLGVLASYPSDSTGAPPSTQGQAETSWTVRARNPTTAAVTYVVSVDCLVGVGSSVTNSVWFRTAGGYIAGGPLLHWAPVECPDSVSAITGGGFDYQPPSSSNPVYGAPFGYSLGGIDVNGLSGTTGYNPSLTWQVLVWAANAIGYAVCVTAPNIFQAPFELASNGPVNESGPGQYQADAASSCPQDELLTGGGFEDYLSGPLTDGSGHTLVALGWPLTTDALTPGTAPTWHVSLNNATTAAVQQTNSDIVDSVAACLRITASRLIRITFSNYHHLLRIPADVVAATDGSGQLKATLVTAHVSQAQSRPLPAVQTINPLTGARAYLVPARCGDPSPAIDAATSALNAQLEQTIPAGQVAFGSPSVSINRGSLTCSPAAGTQRSTPFTYVQYIDGRASQGAYKPSDVVSYQRQQLPVAMRQWGSPYVLGNTLVCPAGPTLLRASATRATLACAAYGVAEWPWSDQTLGALATQLAGQTPSQALAILNAIPGIEPGTAAIQTPGDSTLPSNPDAISIFVAIKQDTAPVLRTPL
jgi:hypothetical protein